MLVQQGPDAWAGTSQAVRFRALAAQNYVVSHLQIGMFHAFRERICLGGGPAEFRASGISSLRR